MSEATTATVTFADLGLPEDLLKYLAERGIDKPTPVQAAVIPLALAGIGKVGGDLLAQARTGSGKTLAFLLPLTAAIRAKECKRAWIVCPTRELAQQVAREAGLVLGANSVATLIGGAPWGLQARELSRHPPLVIGTPGRMCDHLQKGTLATDAEVLVLDEADQMLDMGFKDELDTLVKDLGEGVARWLFSATFPPAVADAVRRWLEKPREVRLDVREASSHVPQKFVVAPRGSEMTALVRLLQVLEPARALVFTRTRLGVEETVQAIALASIEAAGISGDLTQDARDRVLGRFRNGKLPVLVATDVAARGLDVQGVTHVFNLGLPVGAASYAHRIGRTARAGADGEAWTVLPPSDRARFQRMTSAVGCRPVPAEVPTAATIVGARRRRLAVRVEESLGEGLTLPAEFAELVKAHSVDAVLAALVHRLIPDAQKEKDIPRQMASTGRQSSSSATVDLFLGLGEVDGATPATIVATLCRGADISSSSLGRMRIFSRHTVIGVSGDVVERVLATALHFRGRRVPVRPDAHAQSSGDRRSGNDGPPRDFRESSRDTSRESSRDSSRDDRPARESFQREAPRSSALREPMQREAPPRAQAPRAERAESSAESESKPVARSERRESVRLAITPKAPSPNKPTPAPQVSHAKDAVKSKDTAAVPDGLAKAAIPMAKIRVHLPRDSGVSLRTLRKFVCKAGKVSKNAVGAISMGDTSAEVELRLEPARLIAELGEIDVQGHRVRVEFEK